MHTDDFKNLEVGDVVRGCSSGQSFVVTGNYGDHVTAVRSVDLTQPNEWDLVFKIQSDYQKKIEAKETCYK